MSNSKLKHYLEIKQVVKPRANAIFTSLTEVRLLTLSNLS